MCRANRIQCGGGVGVGGGGRGKVEELGRGRIFIILRGVCVHNEESLLLMGVFKTSVRSLVEVCVLCSCLFFMGSLCY